MTVWSATRRAAMPVCGAGVLVIVGGFLHAHVGGATLPSYAVVSQADTVPASAAALFEYLKAARYKSFAHESVAHPSRGQHPVNVIAYLNPALNNSMAAGNTEHPTGSAAILEMLDADGALTGWGGSVKTHAASLGGSGWFWYEVRSTTDGENPAASNWGIPSCVGCHTSGRDFVLSDYPLR